MITEEVQRTANRRLAQWRVSWLIEHSNSNQLLWSIDSFVLRNTSLRQAPNVTWNAMTVKHFHSNRASRRHLQETLRKLNFFAFLRFCEKI